LLKRANILLLANEHRHSDKDISQLLSTSTIFQTKKRFVEDILEAALAEGKRTGQPKLRSANEDAKLISIARSPPPWWPRSLDVISYRRQINYTDRSWKRITGNHPSTAEAQWIKTMAKEDVMYWRVDLWCYCADGRSAWYFAIPADKKHPVVNFDEAI
jgi:hypothetical protein